MDAYGYSALIYACRQGSYSVIKLLLEHGARPNVQTKGGSTALHRASYHGHLQCVCLLLNSGADSTLADSDGKTALHKVNILRDTYSENWKQSVSQTL